MQFPHKKLLLLMLAILAIMPKAMATPPDEGMWLPLLVKRLNYADMKKKGLKLTPEEIYDINNSSLKDAIVALGGGFCTAEVISKEGLLLTNHHCAYDAVQSHSTVEKDYLTNGFWAYTKGQELPNEGLTAWMLVRVEDVSSRILAELKDEMTEAERAGKVRELSNKIRQEAENGTGYTAQVKDFYNGNEYYLFVYEVFRDVRLVGAPAESIGKFGGDTDNWMWPRHTGDFSFFRIYAGKDNKPADYSPDNQPYKPKHHLPISLEGVKKGDYAMVMGYPGRTDRFLSSYGVQLTIDQTNPTRVEIRDKRLALMKEDMDADPATRIKYASKYASIANYWKYWIGETKGLKRLNTVGQKQAIEKQFADWVKADASRQAKYGKALELLKDGYDKLAKYNVANIYYGEAIMGVEAMQVASAFGSVYQMLSAEKVDTSMVNRTVGMINSRIGDIFKDYNAATDEKIAVGLLGLYLKNVPQDLQAPVAAKVASEHGGDVRKFVAHLFANTAFSSPEKMAELLKNPTKEAFEKDALFMVAKGFTEHQIGKINSAIQPIQTQIGQGNRLFVGGLLKIDPTKAYAPNANSTMRITYGQVQDYFPMDGVYYNYYTTATGILEKEDPKNPEFVVPANLKTLLEKKDYGRYGVEGVLPVAFITNNDITGGNSGSPVINGKGQLIGCAFDGNWEAMSGNIAFESDLQRCICVDIRYVLFVVDKLAGAKNLIDEMTIIDAKSPKKPSHKITVTAK